MTKISKAFLSVVLCATFALPFASVLNNDTHPILVRYDYEKNTFVTHKLSYIPDDYMQVSNVIDLVKHTACIKYRSTQGNVIELRQQMRPIITPETGVAITLSDGRYNYLITTNDPNINKCNLLKISESITPSLLNY